MKVVGMRKFQYTSKKTGNTYPAANLYCTEERNNVVGVAAFDLFSFAVISCKTIYKKGLSPFLCVV